LIGSSRVASNKHDEKSDLPIRLLDEPRPIFEGDNHGPRVDQIEFGLFLYPVLENPLLEGFFRGRQSNDMTWSHGDTYLLAIIDTERAIGRDMWGLYRAMILSDFLVIAEPRDTCIGFRHVWRAHEPEIQP
jgi:hypothetical protein